MQQKVVITGATRGVGRALALHFALKKHKLALCARNRQELTLLQQELAHFQAEVIVEVCDISDKKQMNSFTQKVVAKWGSIDVLINNAGEYKEGTIAQTSTDDLEKMIQTNFTGSYHLTRAFLPCFKEKKQGNIIFINSVLGKEYRSNAVAYTISKQAQLTFATLLKEEMRAYNVKVTSILPGSINTSSWDGIDVPKELFVQTDDIVNTVIYILNASENVFVEDIMIRPLNPEF